MPFCGEFSRNSSWELAGVLEVSPAVKRLRTEGFLEKNSEIAFLPH
jgi:hypothetical protein